MNLKELNEGYEEYLLSEEYLAEGLKIFKESKKLFNFVKTLDKKISKLERKNINHEETAAAKKVRDYVLVLSNQYKDVEDGFRQKRIDKVTAKRKLEELKKGNQILADYMKKETTKKLLGNIGLSALVVGLSGLLGSILIPSTLITSIGTSLATAPAQIAALLANAGTSITTGASHVGNFLLGKGARVQKGIMTGISTGANIGKSMYKSASSKMSSYMD